VATLTVTSFSAGTHSLTASYGGDVNNGISSGATSQVVNYAKTTTAVTTSAATVLVGAPVTFTANLSGFVGTPTGTVSFLDGTTQIGTGAVSATGVATFTTSALALGQHSISASYGGDANNGTSSSNALTETIQQTTATNVTASKNPALGGVPVSFTATVTTANGATATGTVKFLDGTTLLATQTLAAGVATYTTSSLSVGSHMITAVYSGDTNDVTSTSTVLSESIIDAGTTTVLMASANPATEGTAVTFTATVTGTGAAPTGTVQFLNGTVVLGTATLNASGVASFTTTTLGAGVQSITASYSGDTNNSPSVSAAVSEVVQSPTTTIVNSSSNPATTGNTVTLTATVTETFTNPTITPTGTVSFYDGTTLLGKGTLAANGTATTTVTTFAVGTHSITAVYSGDQVDLASTSNALSENVVAVVTKTSLGLSSSTATTIQQVVMVAVVSSTSQVPITGTITFLNGTTVIGTAAVQKDGSATLLHFFAVGKYNLTASYGGDTSNTPSVSGADPLTVTLAGDPEISVTPNAATITSGQHTNLTVTLQAQNGFDETMQLGCAGLPALVNCYFTPSTVTVKAGGTASSNLLIDTASPILSGESSASVRSEGWSKVFAAGLLPMALLGLLLVRGRRKFGPLLSALLLVAMAGGTMVLSGCGTVTASSAAKGTYNIVVTAISEQTNVTHSFDVTLTVQ
jgi:hypothetical protein